MKRLSSDALTLVDRALGAGGVGGGSQHTEFSDGVLDQVLEVGPIVRRSRALAGMYVASILMEHAGAGWLSHTVDPYNPPAGNVGGYPKRVPDDMELWLLGASLRRTAGTGDAGGLLLWQGELMGGFGITNSDVAASLDAMAIAGWVTGEAVVLTGQRPRSIATNGTMFVQTNLRLQRGGALLTIQTDATAIADWKMTLMLGLFPLCLGQDGAF